MKYSDGSLYEGYYCNDKRHGRGYLTLAKGDTYDGNFEAGIYHGFGKYVHSDGSCYEGHFIGKKKEGKGKFTYANGDVYDGMWRDNKRHGFGVLVCFDGGDQYEGIWKDDKLEGLTLALAAAADKTSDSNSNDCNISSSSNDSDTIHIHTTPRKESPQMITFDTPPSFHASCENSKSAEDAAFLREITVNIVNTNANFNSTINDSDDAKKQLLTYDIDPKHHQHQHQLLHRIDDGDDTYSDETKFSTSQSGGAEENVGVQTKGQIVYPNGDFYDGGILNGMRSGRGKLVSKSGELFYGLFIEDKPVLDLSQRHSRIDRGAYTSEFAVLRSHGSI
jgi:hypothetical protein